MKRAFVLAILLLTLSALPHTRASAQASQVSAGRVLGATRGQVGWLDLMAPRPTLLTNLQKPMYPADVAAVDGTSFGVASVVSAFGGHGNEGADLLRVDLASGALTPLVARTNENESLEVPAFIADGSGILFQRSDLRAPLTVLGQATPQYRSRIEQILPDGSSDPTVLDNARYPAPAPDGTQLAFVRSTGEGTGLYVHFFSDGSDATLVPPGQFLAIAYPRFSPDGRQLAFAAVETSAPIGNSTPGGLFGWIQSSVADAHGFPWEVWLVNADGSDLRMVPDLLDDDPSVAWSPDGSQLLVYGGWGSFLVDATSLEAQSLTYVVGYGSIAWLRP